MDTIMFETLERDPWNALRLLLMLTIREGDIRRAHRACVEGIKALERTYAHPVEIHHQRYDTLRDRRDFCERLYAFLFERPLKARW